MSDDHPAATDSLRSDGRRRALGRDRGQLEPFALVVVIWAMLAPSTWANIGGRFHAVLVDDAMISMSFARTWVRTGQLVWYPGAPRVEGFSNPAWTALMAGLHAVSIPDRFVGVVVQLIGLACTLACVELSGRLAHRLGFEPKIARLTRWCSAAFIPLGYWAVSGMEVPACAAVVLWVALACSLAAERGGSREWSSLALALAVALSLRLDLIVIVAPMALAAVMIRRPNRQMWPLVAVPTVFAFQLALRQAYYGAWLPNTFRLKSSGLIDPEQLGSGVTIAIAAVAGSMLVVMALAVVGLRTAHLAVGRHAERPHHWMRMGVFAALPVTVAYVVWIGGDFMDAGNAFAISAPNRFLTTVVPAVMPFVAVGITRVADFAMTRRPATVCGAATAAACVSGGLVLISWGLWRGYWLATPAVTPLRINVAAGHAAIIAVGSIMLVTLVATTHRRPLVLVSLVAALAAWSGFGTAWEHLGNDGHEVQRDRSVVGRALQQATGDDTTIAVAAAGSQIYFSERAGIDQLGKMDRRIAEGPVRQHPFIAGHSKWDDQYSLLERQPDVIMDLWGATPETMSALEARGYRTAGAAAGVGELGPLVAPTADVDAERLCELLARTLSRCTPTP